MLHRKKNEEESFLTEKEMRKREGERKKERKNEMMTDRNEKMDCLQSLHIYAKEEEEKREKIREKERGKNGQRKERVINHGFDIPTKPMCFIR